MATAPKVEDTPAKTEAVKVVRLFSVHGDMVHATDLTRFNTETSKKHELDAWVQIQLDAGKLKIDSDE
jgi:hypothetical protein